MKIVFDTAQTFQFQFFWITKNCTHRYLYTQTYKIFNICIDNMKIVTFTETFCVANWNIIRINYVHSFTGIWIFSKSFRGLKSTPMPHFIQCPMFNLDGLWWVMIRHEFSPILISIITQSILQASILFLPFWSIDTHHPFHPFYRINKICRFFRLCFLHSFRYEKSSFTFAGIIFEIWCPLTNFFDKIQNWQNSTTYILGSFTYFRLPPPSFRLKNEIYRIQYLILPHKASIKFNSLPYFTYLIIIGMLTAYSVQHGNLHFS